MIPLLAFIRVQARARLSRKLKPLPAANIRLWIPLFLLWLLLLPFMVVIVPLMIVVCLVVRINPFRALAFFWQVFAGLRGTNIEVNDGNAAVVVRIF
ncbi:MAG TPA: hypothetical protein VI488_05585 [Candidatus Angelobacter sp.]